MRLLGRAFSSSYAAGEAAARRFLPLDFRRAADRAARTRAAAAAPPSPAVLEILRAQQVALPPSAARAAALDALARGGAAIVVTGQQAGLFLGPLYGFYKAASAIAVARALERESGVRCVPLFWLQTEDHDFAEIASVTVSTSAGAPVRLTLAAEPSAAPRASVAHRRLGEDVGGLLDALAEALGPAPAAAETIALLARHYRPGRAPGAAFAGAMAELFADEGLLFLDPRSEAVARLAAPLHRRAIGDAVELGRRLEVRRDELAAAGFDEQIATRPGCALSFFHPDGPTGDRFRLTRVAANAWGLSGRDGTLADGALEGALARAPLCFSTSALLRPLLQDSLLPTAAYVGGPAEVSYFAQLAPLYELFGLSPPLVVPRARFRCLDAGDRRRLEQLGIGADDVARPREVALELARRPPTGGPGGRSGPDAQALAVADRDDILARVDKLAAAAAAVDAADRNLGRAAERTRATVARALGRLTDRAARTALARDRTASARLDRLVAALCPGGVPQERAYGWPSLAGRHGPAALKRLVFERLAEAGPFGGDLLDLRP
jgi:bacillithiol biosynthesis cysteine-adding enzyme BshC